MAGITSFPSHVGDRDCIVVVLGATGGEPGQRPIHDRRTSDLVDPGSPPVEPEVEFELMDSSTDELLNIELTYDDAIRIEQECFDALRADYERSQS